VPSSSPLALPDITEVSGRLRLGVTRLARLLRQQDQSGMTPSQTTALATIFREGPLTLKQLAAHEQLTPPTITKIVANLEERGLVSRRTDSVDRRVSNVQVTTAGRRQVDVNRLRRAAWLTDQIHDLEPHELARLDAALDVIEKLAARNEPVQR
jgi:DNA-binding MarR family transcriptional regulator